MTRTRADLAAAVFVLSVTAAHADEAGEKLVRDYISALDSSPGWASSAKAIHSEGSKIIVDGWSASLESGALKKSTAVLALEAVAGASVLTAVLIRA